MKKLIVFVTCQRTGSSISASLFYHHGMSLGPFALFQGGPNRPHGVCEAMPVFRLNRTLHRIVYGFEEDGIEYGRAGKIMKERNEITLDVGTLPPGLIDHGIETIRFLTSGVPIAGFKHPATVLFWPYWQHVFSRFPELEVIPVFLLRPPTGIAASYARRARRPEFQNEMFLIIPDFGAAFFWPFRILEG